MFPVPILAETPPAGNGWAIVQLVLAGLGLVSLVLVWRTTRFSLPRESMRPELPRRPWTILLALAVGVVFASSFFSLLAVFVPLALGPQFATGTFESPTLSFAGGALRSAIGYSVSIVLALGLLAIVKGPAPRADFSLAVCDIRHGLLAAALTLPLIALVSALGALAHQLILSRPIDDVAHETLREIIAHRTSWWVIAVAACSVVLAPILEEIAFRAFLQTGLLHGIGAPWPAIVITSIIFTALHIGPVPAESFAFTAPTLFVLSVAMGFAYERTRSLIVPVTIHVTFNALNFALALLSPAST